MIKNQNSSLISKFNTHPYCLTIKNAYLTTSEITTFTAGQYTSKFVFKIER